MRIIIKLNAISAALEFTEAKLNGIIKKNKGAEYRIIGKTVKSRYCPRNCTSQVSSATGREGGQGKPLKSGDRPLFQKSGDSEGESGLTLGTDPGFFRPLRRGRF